MKNSLENLLYALVGASLSFLWFSYRNSHAHCQQKIQAERRGRIKLEKKLREKVVHQIADSGYPLMIIGNCKSPYSKRRGTPRQGLLVPNSLSRITLSPEIPTETLLGLETYSHIFILFLFHENTNLVKTLVNNRVQGGKLKTFSNRVQTFAARVCPPLLNGDSIGLFATRSPHRPNAIGQSLARIVSVDLESKSVLVSGADLVDGTPIIDLKPWGPFDCPSCLHQVVEHEGLVGCKACEYDPPFVPDWVQYGLHHPYKLKVVWTMDSKQSVINHVEKGNSSFFSPGNSNGATKAIEQILGLDIRSVHRGRGQEATHQEYPTDLIGENSRQTGQTQNYELDFDIFHIDFVIKNGNDGTFIEIFSVELSTESQ